MYIHSIEAENFRGLPKLSMKFHRKLNVFIGNNGVGKTSILDFLTIMISRCRLLTNDRQEAKNSDINNGASAFNGRICCGFKSSFILAEYFYTSQSSSEKFFENTTGNFEDDSTSFEALAELHKTLENEDIPFSHNYPLVVFYPTNRAILEIPERIRGFKPALHPFDAQENALSSSLDFRSFITLFRQSEQAVVTDQPRLFYDNYKQWQIKQIDAVNRAISSVIPEFGKFHVNQKPFRISIRKKAKSYEFLQLSDGEKCLIALLGDLAQRLAIANPAMDNPLKGEAIVFIDELELHMHPAWQSLLINRLLKTFPNCQFIITTHSPLVLGEVNPESIWIMSEDDPPYHPERSYGMDASEVLEEVMKAGSRSSKVEEAIEKVAELIDTEKFDEARALIQKLAEKTGKISAIYDLNSYLTMLGEAEADIQEL